MTRILKKYCKGGGAINSHYGKMVIENTINDYFLTYYYNMRRIINDIREYIKKKEQKVLHLTDDDIIEIMKIQKMNIAKKHWYNPDGTFKGYADRTGYEDESYEMSVQYELVPTGGVFKYHTLPSSCPRAPIDHLRDGGKLINDPIYYYRILYRPRLGSIDEREVEKFLEEIYEIYKMNEEKYTTTFY